MDNPLNYLNTMKSFLKTKIVEIETNPSGSEEKVYTKKDFLLNAHNTSIHSLTC